MALDESFWSFSRRRQLCGARSRHLYAKKELIDRLWLDDELDGHQGCVNCLQWNDCGSLLASGSDDRTVKIWDPHRGKKKVDLKTSHREIIFSVKFLPNCGDRLLASGSADCEVHLHDVNRAETVEVWNCHRVRVKRLAVSAEKSHTIWSGSEDGTVHQLDIRSSHRKCEASADRCPDTIIKAQIQVKCIAINPVRTHLLAVGLADRIVRVYDLRFIHDNEVVRYFCPGGVICRTESSYALSVTYVSWSADGRKLLANYSGDQVYMFDVDDSTQVHQRDHSFSVPQLPSELAKHPHVTNGYPADTVERNKEALETLAGRLESLEKSQLSSMVGECWSLARRKPLLPEAHNQLRLKLKERSWRGDRYAAMREARFEAALQPESPVAALHLVEAYCDLRWWKLAQRSLASAKERFPGLDALPEYAELVEKMRDGDERSNGDRRHSSTTLPSEGVIDSRAHFCGHLNELTDIKEANFLDPEGKYVVAGSDDRMIYIWETESTRLVRAMLGDSEVVNCCQPHHDQLLLATSGIDNTIRLWSPQDMASAHIRPGDLQLGAELEERASNNHRLTLSRAQSFGLFSRLVFLSGIHEL